MFWRNNLCRVTVLVISMLCANINAQTREDSLVQSDDQPDKELVKKIKRSILEERASIRTGVFNATVTHKNVDGGYTVKSFCAFDRDKGLRRTNRTVYYPDGKLATALGQCIRKPDMLAYANPNWSTVVIQSPDMRTPRDTNCFDFRSLGLCFESDLASEKTFEWTWDVYDSFEVNDVVVFGKDKIQLTFSDGLRRITFDPTRGYWPITMKQRDKSAYSSREANLELKQIGGTWVPIHYKLDAQYPDRKMSIEIEIEWESVNQIVDPKYFDFMTFESDEPLKVSDRRK